MLSPNAPLENLRGRPRSGSLMKVEEVATDSFEDQSAYVNINAEWVNRKGAWLIHLVLIIVGKIFIDSLPGMTQETSWTIVNLAYLTLSYLMFHWVTGIPFHPDQNGGAYDDLTLWEQIDGGAQYTPTKKWLMCVPIGLFLASTHYTHYDPWVFAINFTALVLTLFPKLPVLHRQRFRFMVEEERSGMITPASGVATPVDGSRTPGRRNSTD
ncbi:Orm1 type endoplasmic reticulum protein [Sistotremastrum niveocremeum HHB9708]|uniref:Orm1 type endoplasmic reticulum protein n=1 Tax=Sistotremastrum niveocremeum HHB9708 TaxID=1314777 RepID=A0A164ZMQ9_9AGAM|nr:Orm1 type endoplasmic reticulum protein [Sistotremastrum niveocremeum HHB9708]